MKTIEPLMRRIWSDAEEEFIDTFEIEGYVVRNDRGDVIGTGETRAEALEAAQRFILLPTRRTARA